MQFFTENIFLIAIAFLSGAMLVWPLIRSRAGRRLLRDERGITIVEFALISLPLCMVLLAIIDFGYRMYLGAVVEGTVHRAARLATVGNKSSDYVDNFIREELSDFSNHATITIDKRSYYQFSGVGKPEKIIQDTAPVGEYNVGDCYEDVNNNGVYDTVTGIRGLGGSDDIVYYEVTASFPRIVPLDKMARLVGHRAGQGAHGAPQPAVRRTDRASREVQLTMTTARLPLRRSARRTARLLARLKRDTSGLALIEFAISLPVALTLGLVGIELSNYAIANLRVSQIAMTVADNAARVRDSIDETDINELFIGARLVGDSINFADHGRIILSSLEPKTSGTAGQWIRWQRCYGLKNASSQYGVPTTMTASTLQGMGPSTRRIRRCRHGGDVRRVVYDYQPIVSNRLLGNKTLRFESAFNVRQRNDHVMKDGNLPASAWSTCNRYYV